MGSHGRLADLVRRGFSLAKSPRLADLVRRGFSPAMSPRLADLVCHGFSPTKSLRLANSQPHSPFQLSPKLASVAFSFRQNPTSPIVPPTPCFQALE